MDPVEIYKFRAVMSPAVVQARTHDSKQRLVSSGLASLRDEDLRLLSFNTQGAGEPCLGGPLRGTRDAINQAGLR